MNKFRRKITPCYFTVFFDRYDFFTYGTVKGKNLRPKLDKENLRRRQKRRVRQPDLPREGKIAGNIAESSVPIDTGRVQRNTNENCRSYNRV